MTYDDWKLETPEDERDRKARFWGTPPMRCRDCGTLNLDESNCRNCDSEDLVEDSPDPDDARDNMQDREWNR